MVIVKSLITFLLLTLILSNAAEEDIKSSKDFSTEKDKFEDNNATSSFNKYGAVTLRDKNRTDIIRQIRPVYGNIEDLFENDYYENAAKHSRKKRRISMSSMPFSAKMVRLKRKASEKGIFDLRKQFRDITKNELMAADAKPRMEPNQTVVADYGRTQNIEQTYNRQIDKIRLLKMHQPTEREKEIDSYASDCDFESPCLWGWRKDIAHGFFITSSTKIGTADTGPREDAFGRKSGQFLMIRLPMESREFHVTSPNFHPTAFQCKLDFWVYQEAMIGGEIRVVGDKYTNHSKSINNHTQWVVGTIRGSNSKTWEHHSEKIGRISENFTIILEVVPSNDFKPEATVAFDNIQLNNCYNSKDNICTPHQYKCKGTSVAMCVNRTSICDITRDCKNGDDETQNCDRVPYGARCTFEEDWCGWHNVDVKTLEWSRHNGSTPTNLTGPNFDHTYQNATGNYLFVNMLKDGAALASGATLKSVTFNPPPKVHGNASSQYYNSCAIRFHIHKTGKHKSAMLLQVTELRPEDNITTDLLWSYNEDHGDRWFRQVVIVPNITYRYYINIIVKKGYRYISDIAIDDISLSPECFGLNIPQEELGSYNYWNPIELHINRETHQDFVNASVHHLGTCGIKGRYGPSQYNCTRAYNGTNLRIKVTHEPGMSGVQKWLAPDDGFYTFILAGAGGGKGSGAMGSSRGALVRTVVELKKDQEVFMLVGQEGSSACVKTLGHRYNSTCNTNSYSSTPTSIRAVLYMEIMDSGGGGGGGTFLFIRNRTRDKIPLAVAGGGGGLGLGQFVDNGRQHGQIINLSRQPISGKAFSTKLSGPGGGWNNAKGTEAWEPILKQMMGSALSSGAFGGKACYNSTDGRGDGGYGGGGAGCRNGGGGGGYAGGDASSPNSTNGDGGYSFLDIKRTLPDLSEVRSGANSGPGYVMIIPAIAACGCDYRCVALDDRRSQVQCICPQKWKLAENQRTCIPLSEPMSTYPAWVLICLISTIMILVLLFAGVCFVLYNRYQKEATGILRRKILSGADLQLDRLRITSDSIMTEYNPNYEFGGVVYTLKDLKDIPRDQLRLVRALGQGAFGEVYQGFYRQRPCDTVEMPVAVKTLPEMSTSQAEMDFLMEALIMSKFNHPNIVHFIGVCFDKHPRFIVLELLIGGDLKNFLRECRPKPERGSSLTMKDLVLISVDVAKGCKYLEDNRFIHRDIAARNCLLTTKGPGRVVKIADFGMSRDVYRSDYYRKGGKAMLPIKWMPPEAFLDGIFSSKTDVWSFGVLLWEIMSMGYMPYTGLANREVMQLVTSGGRLDPPANCPGPVYGIMTQCWHPNPEQRPTFSTILERLGYCAQDPNVMNAPLPIFHRAPSNERDTTLMRPVSSEEVCLQVVPTSDYMIPNHTDPTGNQIESTSSIEKLLPENSDNWETSFIIPQSKSTQPLLQDNFKEDEETAVNTGEIRIAPKMSPIAIPNHILGNHNNNIKSDSNLKSGISLDAAALAKQSMTPTPKKYANIDSGDNVTGNGVLPNGPFPSANQNTYVSTGGNSKYLNEPEINC